MVKKELTLLDGPPEFEEYVTTVRFPTNLQGDVQNRVLDKIQLAKDASISEDMTEEEMLNSLENHGEIFEEIQNQILEFALKYAEDVENNESIERENIGKEAAEKILGQYTDQIKGVAVGKN